LSYWPNFDPGALPPDPLHARSRGPFAPLRSRGSLARARSHGRGLRPRTLCARATWTPYAACACGTRDRTC